MHPYRRHLIPIGSSIKQALKRLDELAADALVFVVDGDDRLIGSLTDGDVRRGFLRGLSVDNNVEEFIQPNPKFVVKEHYDLDQIIDYRNKNYKVIPVVDRNHRIVNIINFRYIKSYLPVDAVIMAGGKGERLKPLTDKTPKPLLKVGDKSIIEHNLQRLISFGIDDYWISVRYLGEQIQQRLQDGKAMNVSIGYVWENEPLGTIGAVSQIQNFRHDYVLITNSDILTNLDYENFYMEFIKSEADLSVVTIPYNVSIPYAVLETSNGHVVSFREKPTYTYYSNGGIYLMKKDVLKLIPDGKFYNATDLMERLIERGGKVHSYPLRGYWLDIGKPEDFEKAQQDINYITF
jgi:dTDP-glucose pyrophosphorylase